MRAENETIDVDTGDFGGRDAKRDQELERAMRQAEAVSVREIG